MLMYNCGVKNIHEPEVFKMCERDIERYTDDLEPRLVYGALYGALKTNAASPFLMNFFLNEFHKINKLINEKQEIQHEEEIEAENFEEQKEEEKNILVKKKKKKKSPIIFGNK